MSDITVAHFSPKDYLTGGYPQNENVAAKCYSRRFASKSAETLHGDEIQGAETEADGSVLAYVTKAECRKQRSSSPPCNSLRMCMVV